MTLLAPPAPDLSRRDHPATEPSLPASYRVEAEPFRAWVRQLMSDTGLGWRVLARAAAVRSTTVHALLRGRDGRPLTTLPYVDATRLLNLDHRRLAFMKSEPCDADRVQALLWSLALAGCSNRQIAEFSGIDLLRVRTLMGGDSAWCSLLQQARAEAACEVWGINPDLVHRQRKPAPRAGKRAS